ncbi:MAG: hypothetical protein HKN92_03735 [Chitinophagales bacterium]|nr:hypothetical protein [Chitinophagales bacterium]
MKLINTKFIMMTIMLFSIVNLFGQNEIEIREGKKMMSLGESNAFMIMVPQINVKEFEKNWGKKLKEGSKEKVEKANDEMFILNAVKKRITSEPINIYSRFYETPNGIELVVFYQTLNGFISTEGDHEKASAVKVVLTEFGEEMYRLAVENELSNENSALKSLEKDLDKMIKDNEKMHKDISSFEREIERTKQEIAENLGDQERLSRDIEIQKEVLHRIAGATEEQLEVQQKKLDGLERDRKKLIKQNEKMHVDIDNLEAKIRDRERDIVKNNEEQKLKTIEITSQKEVILNVKKKLKSI